MTKATKAAIDSGLIEDGDTSEVYAQGETRICWHDDYFLHLLEVTDTGEIIEQTRPLAGGWEFE